MSGGVRLMATQYRGHCQYDDCFMSWDLRSLCLGLHDFCVRSVSQSSGIFASLLTVLASGIIVLTGVALMFSHPMGMTALYYQLSIASGLSFAVAAVALYIAFSIGPVRLVAPIIGAYPILSVGWSTAAGVPLSLPATRPRVAV